MTMIDHGTSTRSEVSHWWNFAACEGQDVDLFMPPQTRSPALNEAQTEDARSFCERCDVRRDCLVDAIRAGDMWSMRGGLTAEERGWASGGHHKAGNPRLGVCTNCERIFELDEGRWRGGQKYCGDECRKTARAKQQMASQHRKRTP